MGRVGTRRALLGGGGSGAVSIADGAVALASASSQYFSRAHLTQADGAAAWSVAGWFRTTDNTANQTIAAQMTGTGAGNQWILQFRGDTGAVVRAYIANSDSDAGGNYGAGSTSLITNTWYHVACVFDGGGSGNSGRLKLYVNGAAESVSYAGTIPAAMTTNTEQLMIGRLNFGGGVQYVNGAVGPLGLWGRALTAGDISALYAAGSGKRYASLTTAEKTSLVAYYPWRDNLTLPNDVHGGYTLTSFNGPTFTAGPVA